MAIDAEFVAVTQEETRPGPRGKAIVIKPARLALGRVSCVRGDGPNAGVPFIDSYIQQAEPVVDYSHASPACSLRTLSRGPDAN